MDRPGIQVLAFSPQGTGPSVLCHLTRYPGHGAPRHLGNCLPRFTLVFLLIADCHCHSAVPTTYYELVTQQTHVSPLCTEVGWVLMQPHVKAAVLPPCSTPCGLARSWLELPSVRGPC